MVIPTPSSHRLLLVEDDQMVRETIILMLEDNFEVFHVASVNAALARLQAADTPPIEIMILDCLLPRGNVGEVLVAADQQAIPVVLISGDPSQAQRVDPSRPFLPKPFTQSILLAVLDSARR